jgi:HSP20 family protein
MKMNSLMKWRPMDELMPRKFFRSFWDTDMNDVFESFFEPSALKELNWAPKVESYRKNGTYVVKADLPGVEAKDIEVTLEKGCLTIKGERKVDKEVKEKKMERREVFYGSFERSIPVPEGLKPEGVKAKYRDGVLEVTVPVEEKSPPKKIEVEEAKH